MTPNDSQLEAARELIAEKLRGQAWLEAEDVITHKTGDILAKFNEDIAKTGLALVVGISSAREGGSQSARIDWKPAKFFVDVCEYVAARGGDLPGAWAYAESVVAALKLCALGDELFPQICDEDIAEVAPPKDWEHILVVRIPLELHIAGTTRKTTD